jgi:hypothetical protein
VKRSRGRGGRRPPNNNNGGSGGGGGGGGNNNNPNRTFDSNGPEIKIRGSAAHVYEKYLQLARDSNASGDRVMAENYLQHAEHYYRILAANQLQQQQQYQGQPQAHYQGNGGNRPQPNGNVDGNAAPQYSGSGPSFSLAEEGGEDETDAVAES